MMRDFSAFGCVCRVRVPFAEKPGKGCPTPTPGESSASLTQGKGAVNFD
jgi:hypothetical protein